jgi:hypothetical protein
MNLTDPIYTDADKAREHLEAIQWPNGPVCPHCGNVDRATIAKVEGKKKSHRDGLYYCNACTGSSPSRLARCSSPRMSRSTSGCLPRT